MKLKTLNAHPSLFFDLRALVEKVAKYEVVPGAPINADNGLGQVFREARAILEKFKKLEGK